nr:hypothetical protein [Tanacetum cinerariifolium]
MTMATTIEQVALDEALVPSTQRLRIRRSNFRQPSDIQSKESTLQVVYDVLRISPFFKAFLVTADVLEIYIQEFWATAKVHQHSIIFKMDTRKHIINLEAFREMLHISPRVSGQSFAELPFEEEILEFFVINKCLTGKSYGIDSLRLSQAQILWGLYHRSNVDYAYLIWEDLVYQVEHKNQKKSNEMYYPRFTKVIINHFMTKKPSILRRNRVNWHYVRDDILFSTIKVVSRHQNTQQYGAILPIELTTEDIRNTKAYKEYYACTTGEAAPKPKASARRKRGGSDSSTTPPTPIATPTPITTVVAAPRLTAAAKGKQPARATSQTDPSDVEQTKAEQLKIILKRSRQETHISQQGGSSTDEGTDEAKKVNDDDDDEEEISKIDEQEATESGEGDDEVTESDGKNEEEETREEAEESFDPILRTFKDSKDDGNNEEDQGLRISEEERIHEEEEADELYRMESIFTTGSSSVTPIPSPKSIMTPSIITTNTKASQPPIPPTPIPSDILQTLPTFASKPSLIYRVLYINTTEAIRAAMQIQTDRLQDSFQRENDEFLRTIDDNMKKLIKERVKNQVKAQVTKILPRIEESVNAQLEAKVLTRSSHSSRTSYAVAADLSEMELKKILIDNMEGNKSIQRSDEQRNLYKALVKAYEADKTILDSYGESAILKKRREDDDDQEGPSIGSDRGSKRRREGGEHASASTPSEPATRSAGRSTTGTQSRQMSASECKNQPIVQTSQHPEWFSQPRKPPTPDRNWNKTLPAIQGSAQSWISELAKQTDDRSSFNELLDTPIDFSNFIMNRLGVATLTPELLAGPIYELMRGSCTILTELEYHLEEVYKATMDQLDWVNPEGQQYPHNLLQPLPLIPDNRGRRVIPLEHFINNDLEYLRGGALSRKYTTSVTKTKAADYGHIKWIEDLVPHTMWIQEPINYDKNALWGVSHWGRKRQQFYGFAVNQESALDVYSKRRIIAVIDLKIVEWHNYKHLDWISVRRDDDKIYKFKECDFKRLRLQYIEDMPLLLVQGKLSNLTVKEGFTFNVSLRMFTRSIVIQRRVEDLQLGV